MEPIDLSLSQASNVTNLASKSPWPAWYLKYISDLRETYYSFDVLSNYHIFADNALALLFSEPILGQKILTEKLLSEFEKNPSQAVIDLHNFMLCEQFLIFAPHAVISKERAAEYLRQTSEHFNQIKLNLTEERRVSAFRTFLIHVLGKLFGRLDWFEGIQLATTKDRITYIRTYCRLPEK